MDDDLVMALSGGLHAGDPEQASAGTDKAS